MLQQKRLNEHILQEITYLKIIQNMKDGFAIIHDNHILFANTTFFTLMGIESETTHGQMFVDFFPEQKRPMIQNLYEIVLRNRESVTLEECMLVQESIFIELSMSMMNENTNDLVLLHLRNVTSTCTILREVQQRNERLESILHSMHDVVISLSVEDHSILSINSAAEILFGIPLRNLSKATENGFFSMVHPDDREKVQNFYYTLPMMEFNELEYRIVRRDETVRWVRDEGYVVYCKSNNMQRIDHIIRDITQEKQAIQDLHKSERKYKDFFHKTKDMAFTVSPEGFFLDINDAGIELLGLESRKAALHSNVQSFSKDPAVIDEILNELEDKGFITNKYVTLRSASGKSIEVDITARAKKNEAGQVRYYEGIASNITQALENQRNRVLRNTAAGMCHYLNSHLMHLSSATDGMEEELTELDEKFMTSSSTEEKDEIWFSGRNALNGYLHDVTMAYRKISEITRAFNSAFLSYQEEAYLDKTILNIFSTYRPHSKE
ncbi:hypothetical protein MASR1M90_08370 [Desulfovibrionales bacterium]